MELNEINKKALEEFMKNEEVIEKDIIVSTDNASDTDNNAGVAVVEEAKAVVENQRKADLQAISENEEFKNASKLVNERKVYNELKKEANQIKDEELNREWEEYLLKKKKEAQDYRTKLEKNVIKQEVKADVYKKKREIAEKRFGYLYKDMKDFTPSKALNRLKEFRNWYNNLSDTIHKIVNTTLKWVFRLGLTTGGIFALYGILKWLLNNGLVNLIQ